MLFHCWMCFEMYINCYISQDLGDCDLNHFEDNNHNYLLPSTFQCWCGIVDTGYHGNLRAWVMLHVHCIPVRDALWSYDL